MNTAQSKINGPQFDSFENFYTYYLDHHRHPVCRWLHVGGFFFVVTLGAFFLASGNSGWLIILPVVGYSFSWTGHYAFEKNKPATFQYPLFSFIGYFKMIADTIRGSVQLSDGRK